MRIDETDDMKHSPRSIIAAVAIVIALTSSLRAAPNPEITVVPLGNATIKNGVQELSFRLSSASQGQTPQPLVFIAAQPRSNPQAAAEDANPPAAGNQVPATLSIEIGGKALPDWVLSAEATAYVINLDTIRANPEFAAGRVRAKLHMKSNADMVVVAVLGMPDPRLVGGPNRTSLNGPLAEFARAATQQPARDYFGAMIDEFAGRQDAAVDAFGKLRSSDDVDVARFARRSIRRIEYLRRISRLSGNFLEHYRWGLYLQFCGLYRPAYDEFEECRMIHPPHEDAQFRAAECFEIIGSELIGLIDYIDRCELSAPAGDVTRFDVLALIQQPAGDQVLSDEELAGLIDHLTITRKMIAAATSGAIRLDISIRILKNDEDTDFVQYPNGAWGPRAARLDRDGWFDGVITIRPSTVGTVGTDVHVSPVGQGPKGTTAASTTHGARWSDFVEIVYRMMSDAGRQSGASPTLPAAVDAVTAGIAPSPHIGFSCRSALRYRLPRNEYAGLDVAELPLEESFLRSWRIDGPYEPSESGGAFQQMPIAEGDVGQAVVSDSSRISLESVSGSRPNQRVRATCWVYVPGDQIVQLRTDQQQALGVRVNGRVIRGDLNTDSDDTRQETSAYTGLRLLRGWNTLEIVTSVAASGVAPTFRASLLTTARKPIGGLASLNKRPQSGVIATDNLQTDGRRMFNWDDVRDDWRYKLPLLDLAAATGASGIHVTSDVGARTGYIAVTIPARKDTATYRSAPAKWSSETDRDVVFNNLLDWHREWCLGIHVDSGERRRQLLFVRPEGVEAVVRCLREGDKAMANCADTNPIDRLIGRIEVPGNGCVHDLIVLDVCLGDESTWPIDEEDLLAPLGDFVPNSEFIGVTEPMLPTTLGG